MSDHGSSHCAFWPQSLGNVDLYFTQFVHPQGILYQHLSPRQIYL